jgi:hypothetical protein
VVLLRDLAAALFLPPCQTGRASGRGFFPVKSNFWRAAFYMLTHKVELNSLRSND